jgi:hypothetical protein
LPRAGAQRFRPLRTAAFCSNSRRSIGGIVRVFAKARKRFFLKKEAKTLAVLSRSYRAISRQRDKSFLVLFFKKEPLFTPR